MSLQLAVASCLCKGFTWGNFRNFECLYLIGVGYVAGGFPAIVIPEILA